MNAEARDDRIERAVGIRHVLGVAFSHRDGGIGVPCNADHRGREIQSLRGRAACSGRRGDMAGSARDVEHALAGANTGSLQQRRDEGRCRMRERVVVARRRALPPGMLERADGFGLKGHGGGS